MKHKKKKQVLETIAFFAPFIALAFVIGIMILCVFLYFEVSSSINENRFDKQCLEEKAENYCERNSKLFMEVDMADYPTFRCNEERDLREGKASESYRFLDSEFEECRP